MMLRARDFTVESLHKETQINQSTIRTVIGRYRSALDEESVPTGMPGGQPVVYSIKPEARAAIQKEVQGLFDEASGPLSFDKESSPLSRERHASVPAELRAAEFLLQRAERASGEGKVRALSQAAKNLAVVERVVVGGQTYRAVASEVRSRLQDLKQRVERLQVPTPGAGHGEVIAEEPILEPALAGAGHGEVITEELTTEPAYMMGEVVVTPVREEDNLSASFVCGMIHGHDVPVRMVSATGFRTKPILKRGARVFVTIDSTKKRAEARKYFYERLSKLQNSVPRGSKLCVVDMSIDHSIAAAVASVSGRYIPNALNISFNTLFGQRADEKDKLAALAAQAAVLKM